MARRDVHKLDVIADARLLDIAKTLDCALTGNLGPVALAPRPSEKFQRLLRTSIALPCTMDVDRSTSVGPYRRCHEPCFESWAGREGPPARR
jgi:hypothetical protein